MLYEIEVQMIKTYIHYSTMRSYLIFEVKRLNCHPPVQKHTNEYKKMIIVGGWCSKMCLDKNNLRARAARI